jgi:hypothetical protein
LGESPLKDTDALQIENRLGDMFGPGFQQDVLPVIIDGMGADEQPFGDGLAVQALCDQ